MDIKAVREKQDHHLKLRNLEIDDFEQVKALSKLAYPFYQEEWTKKEIEFLISNFKDGQICIEDNGKLVAFALSIIVDYKKIGDRHTYPQIIDHGKFGTHQAKGDTLYGVEVIVHPDHRGMRLGRRLYDARKEICYDLNLKRIVTGGRIPGYQEKSKEMTPQQYVKNVAKKEIYDPILSFQLSNGFFVKRVLKNYLPGDLESKNYATLLEWVNIYFEEDGEEEAFERSKDIVRIGTVQWQMRPTSSLEGLIEQIEYFVDAVSDYQSDIVIFPEFFNGPLMAKYNDDSPSEAVRKLAEYTIPIRDEMARMALEYNINIIAGTMPEYVDETLKNVSYLCRRDGTWERQYKIHVTPDEYSVWGMEGGNEVQVFETDFGKIGILICYDVEFPELSRLLAEENMQILFVPYWTDTQNGYQRVRHCAQARAIENECYVVLSGSTGNLPKAYNMDMQYSQSCILTPSDFPFPHDCVAAESTPNTEMTLIADLNMESLKKLHNEGSVRNLKDRRHDIYKLERVKKKSKSKI